MAKYVVPRFDFAGPIPLEGDGQVHTAERQRINDLSPSKFNEFERVMVEIGDVIGDYELSDMIPGAPDVIGGAIRRLYEVMITNLSLKVNKSGDVMTGDLTITGADLNLTGNINQAGNQTIAGGSIITGDLSVGETPAMPGHIVARAIEIEWVGGMLYRVGDLVIYEKKMYRCKGEHTSSASFINDHANGWELVGGGGSTTRLVHTSPHNHSFSVGEPVYYDGDANSDFGYIKAQANHTDRLAIGIVAATPDTDSFLLMTAGYINSLGVVKDEDDNWLESNTWYYLSESVAGALTKTSPSLTQPVLYTLDTSIAGTLQVEEGYVLIGSGSGTNAVSHVDTFTVSHDGESVFALSHEPISKDYTIVSIMGVLQHEGAYSVNESQLMFSPPVNTKAGQVIRVQYWDNVNAQPAASIYVREFVSTLNQTEFDMSTHSTPLTITPLGKSFIVLSVDGDVSKDSDWTLDGKKVIFGSGQANGAEVRIQVFHNLNILIPPDNSIKPPMLHQDFRNVIDIDETQGVALVSTLSVTDDHGGIVNSTTLTSGVIESGEISDGIGTIRLRDSGTVSDSTGFVKIYVGTQEAYIPYFTDIEGV
jgi:hypothetical protein